MNFRKALSATAFCIAAALGTSAAASPVDISNTIGVGSISPFGASNTATYGQTFTADSIYHYLTGFSLFLNGRVGGTSLNLRGYIGAWDGSKATSILYTSSTRSMGVDGLSTEFSFDTSSLDLVGGSQYVAFLSISELGLQSQSTYSMPYTGNNIAGGTLVFLNNGTNFGALTSTTWDCPGCIPSLDMAFKAQFSETGITQVPEPGSLALAGIALAGLFAARRKKYRRA